MKYETFIKHTVALVEKTLEKGKKTPLYQNTEDALFFTPDIETPYYAYRLEGWRPDQPGKAKTVDFERLFKGNDGVFAEKDETETEWNGKTVVRFRTEDGQRDGNADIEGPEDIDGYMYYAHEWGIDGIRLEIAESEGVKPEEVKLWEFDGYNKTPRYKEAV